MNFANDRFADLLKEKGISLSSGQLDQFDLYFRLLVEWNEKMNLTGITERDAVYEKHFYDSLSLSFFADMNSVENVADIGSGAGFPSIPLKICFPHLKVTIVDSLNKRILFLQHLAEALGLKSFDCVHGRAEDVARLPQHREWYDLVTARAVARLNVLNELCLPFVKVGGTFIAMKGPDSEAELKEAANSLIALNGKIKKVFHFQLPYEQAERTLIVTDKEGKVPSKFPRKAGMPLKQPIV